MRREAQVQLLLLSTEKHCNRRKIIRKGRKSKLWENETGFTVRLIAGCDQFYAISFSARVLEGEHLRDLSRV
jgi:hypothetical protein